MRAIQVSELGGPEVLREVELPDPEPAEGEVLVRVARAGVNFADTHQTRDEYLAGVELPFVPGGEVSGTVVSEGSPMSGRRVAALLAGGGYAELVAVSEPSLVPVPDEVSDDDAAAILLQGLTARTMLRVSARVEAGEAVVVSAAAGGTGTLSVQLAKRIGARVIALASSPEKRELALRLGADAAVDSRTDDLAAAIVEANGGEPVDVVLEMAGGEAFDACFEALAPFGRLVTFGIASGKSNQLNTRKLMQTSRAVIGFWLVQLFRRPELLREGIEELLAALAADQIEVVIGGLYPLSDAARAHEALRARRTQGKLLLDPSR